ncbi:UDP-N-acetylmuramoyl-tripeptide--D-alanyl-D-alanine ligase [Spirabiliibacterium falconis]|uniref:UDP-N-acetylmuramoyl-tripeptide--D-alanyl-D- alanine ligase n=1 Tax=Spirabiliibacterium falconis TaxID=572023 RepID=UPI001AADB24D|nr:UDP-N-acetylmuramoyl-tripeptide--D-alanyl-D-alanine ligase [Spirabiliibacterium falconis]MBE2894717.1 UDP-N-acetylmuramoyl-tripeptide--D-alanyl-D-alanine ligase [Spirabiliibacterium falconis]
MEQGLIRQLCDAVARQAKARASSELDKVLIVSASDGVARAKVQTLWFDNAQWHADALAAAVQHCLTNMQAKFTQPLIYLRLEWVVSAKAYSWQALPAELDRYKRNYFRSGLAFRGVREPWLLLTEMELNANACLYTGNEAVSAAINQGNLERYLKARHGSSQMPDFAPESAVWMFQTAGVFADAQTQQIHSLSSVPRFQGHRDIRQLDLPLTEELIDLAAHYLGRQVRPTGQYEYGHFPCFGKTIATYNMLRHASSTYALIEGYEALQHALQCPVMPSENAISPQRATPESLAQMQQQIDAALAFLLSDGIRYYDDKAYVVDTGDEIKLGANAVAILALVKYLSVFPESKVRSDYLALCEQLALGIVAMQRENGQFVHVLHAHDLSVKAEQRIIYYDGEAAFALMRLFGLTQDRRWLDCVVKAFDYFIANHHEKAHDHWLSYCSNELVKYLPEKKYFAFAVRNVQGYVDFIKNRITTFPTLLELSIAFHQMLLKLDDFPDYRQDVLAGFDVAAFYEALHTRAHYLINGFFFPEMAMFFKAPQSILHGMFIRHHGFRVRIDDVEHYLSGLIAYRQLLAEIALSDGLNTTPHQAVALNAESLPRITQGKWLVKPEGDWQASGVCVWPKSFQAGHLLVARGREMSKGYLPPVSVNALARRASGVITDDPDYQVKTAIPVLWVKDIRKAVLAIGKARRKGFAGQVVGVTGSAGKTTTVAMLAHALGAVAEVAQTLASANLPVGIAWNMASMPPQADFWVLEMAIGNMQLNSELVCPDVAIITNIAPAHLAYHGNVENIAVKKSRIFSGMNRGGVAIVCRDIAQFDMIRQAAEQKGLQMISYGEHAEADIRLLEYSPLQAHIMLPDGTRHTLQLAATGKHQALNALAVLAVVQHFGLNLQHTITALASFHPVAGRGSRFQTAYDGKIIDVIDDAYNANPLSMAASLEYFAQIDSHTPSQKVLILGDMLELGEQSAQYHRELAHAIMQTPARDIILVGDSVQHTADVLAQHHRPCHRYPNTETLKTQLTHHLQNGDLVLLKSSYSVGLNGVFGCA